MQMMYLLDCRPLTTKTDNNMELFNEISISLIVHISFHFLNPMMGEDLKILMGWILIGITSFNICVNLGLVVRNFINEQLKKVRKRLDNK